MKKNLVNLAVLAVAAAPLSALADVEVYGKMKVSVNFDSNDSDPDATKDDSKISVLSNNSRIGVRGSEDLGAGLKAIYTWENQVQVDEGEWRTQARDTYVGLAGDWGKLMLGRKNTPHKQSTRSLDPFVDTVGDYNTVILTDRRMSNTIYYWSPDMNGLVVAAGFAPDYADDDLPDSTPSAADIAADGVNSQEQTGFSGMATYSAGPLFLAGAYEVLGESSSVVNGNTYEDLESLKFGASYKFGDAKINFVYANDDAGGNNNDRDQIYFSGTYKMGSTVWKAAFGQIADLGNSSNTGADFIALGASQWLSKKTEVYAIYAAISNDTNSSFGLKLGPAPAAAGKDVSSFAIGIHHNFSSK